MLRRDLPDAVSDSAIEVMVLPRLRLGLTQGGDDPEVKDRVSFWSEPVEDCRGSAQRYSM
jgi:hypothetical protein